MRIRGSTSAVPTAVLMTIAAGCGSSESSPGPKGKDGGPDDTIVYPSSTIVSSTPANGDDNVSVRAPIQVTYSEPVQLGKNAFTLVGPGSVTLGTTVSLSDDRKTVTITPVAPLVAPGTLSVTVNDVTAVGGGSPVEKRAWSWSVPQWLRVGGETKGAASYQTSPMIATGPGGRVVTTALREGMTVESIDGDSGNWTQLGDPVERGVSQFALPSMLVDKSGAPVVAFEDSHHDVRVRRWNGTNWEDVGGALGHAGDTMIVWFHGPAMAMTSTGTLFVAYAETGPGNPPDWVYVKSFSNGVWTQLGGAVNDASEEGKSIGLALSDAGIPYVVYDSGRASTSGTHFARVRKWSGAQWERVGGDINQETESFGLSRSIAFDVTGNPVVFGCFGNVHRVRRFDGIKWLAAGDSPLPGCGTYSSFLAKGQNGQLFAFWSDGDGRVFQVADVTSPTWKPLDTPVSAAKRDASSLAIDPNGAPVIAWLENDTLIRVRRLNR